MELNEGEREPGSLLNTILFTGLDGRILT